MINNSKLSNIIRTFLAVILLGLPASSVWGQGSRNPLNEKEQKENGHLNMSRDAIVSTIFVDSGDAVIIWHDELYDGERIVKEVHFKNSKSGNARVIAKNSELFKIDSDKPGSHFMVCYHYSNENIKVEYLDRNGGVKWTTSSCGFSGIGADSFSMLENGDRIIVAGHRAFSQKGAYGSDGYFMESCIGLRIFNGKGDILYSQRNAEVIAMSKRKSWLLYKIFNVHKADGVYESSMMGVFSLDVENMKFYLIEGLGGIYWTEPWVDDKGNMSFGIIEGNNGRNKDWSKKKQINAP